MNAFLLLAVALSLDVTTKSPFHVVDFGSDEVPVAILSNTNAAEAVSWKGELRVVDYYGRRFAFSAEANLKPGEKAEVPLPADYPKGVWTVSTDFDESRFAVLDARKATPRIPFGTFRMGINIHYERLPRDQQLLATDAAMRLGAKIVRALGTFDAPYKYEERRGWANTFEWKDTMLRRMEDDGLAVNALFSMMWHYTDIAGPYLTAVAKRYGERLDYYEIGNEWDLVRAEEATPTMAAGMQLLCYGALKRGNPKVRVATNGFAVEDSNGHNNVTQKGFQESFLRLARGAYDIHTMHLHFPFYDFERRLEKLYAMRKATGTTEPIFLNECALTATYRSEQSVAENVWQKFVHSWSEGVTDQIWYDLVGHRNRMQGGYALMTRDFRPRLAYAAFSALARILEGCECKGRIVRAESRRVYRFVNGKGYEIYIGWDPAIQGREPIDFALGDGQARTLDVMGNVVDSGSTWNLQAAPTAFVVKPGAAGCRPDLKALSAARKAPPHVMDVKPNRYDCGWDLHLFKVDFVHENYPADPFTAHRQWKGPKDLSADVLFSRKDLASPATLRVTVHDEKDEKGDAVHVFRDGREITGELSFKRVRHGDGRTTYDAVWPDLKNCRFDIRIDDDDGFGGLDGYMEYAPSGADADLERWPILKFD